MRSHMSEIRTTISYNISTPLLNWYIVCYTPSDLRHSLFAPMVRIRLPGEARSESGTFGALGKKIGFRRNN